MAEAAPDDGDSKHIIQLAFDIMHYSDHRKYDKQIRKLLQDPVNQHLRYPKSRRDYFGLVKIIIEKYDLINDREDSHFKTIEAKYTGDNVSDEVFKDFKTMIDICLVYGRFRDIRILFDFYTHDEFLEDYKEPLHWNNVAGYLFPTNRRVDWKDKPKTETF